MVENSDSSARSGGFDRAQAFKSVGFSLTVNALCPFLLYWILQAHFPPDSLRPLLYATVFPVLGLIFSLARKRAIDLIAVIAMAGLALHIVAVLIAPTVGIALVLRSLDGTLIGLALIVSTMIHRPIFLYVAKRAVAGNSDRAAALDRVIEIEGGRSFSTMTLVWGIALVAMSDLHVLLAIELMPANFLLVSPIAGVVAVAALFAWSGRYIITRMRTVLARNT